MTRLALLALLLAACSGESQEPEPGDAALDVTCASCDGGGANQWTPGDGGAP